MGLIRSLGEGIPSGVHLQVTVTSAEESKKGDLTRRQTYPTRVAFWNASGPGDLNNVSVARGVINLLATNYVVT